MTKSIVQMSLIALLAAVIVTTAVTAGAQAQPAPLLVAGSAIAVEDSSGRIVSLGAAAERIVSFSPGAAEVLFAVGAGDRLVGRSLGCDYPAEALAIPVIGGSDGESAAFRSAEALSPDLVIEDSTGGASRPESPAKEGFAVFIYAPRDFRGLAEAMMALGSLAGKQKEGIVAAARLTKAYRSVASIAEGIATSLHPKVLWLSGGDRNPATCGSDSFFHALIAAAGGRDIFSDYAGVSPPVILAEAADRAPEAIISIDGGDSPDSLSRTPAARRGRLYRLEPGLGTRVGPRSATALLFVARFLHPDIFP